MYKVIWKKDALKALEKISKPEAMRIRKKVDSELAINPHKYEQLQGFYSGHQKFRVGNYRIIYTIQEQTITITITKVGHRSDVYK
jgi:mRNA interferase RelE/StbE